jgi:hypothetical protein
VPTSKDGNQDAVGTFEWTDMPQRLCNTGREDGAAVVLVLLGGVAVDNDIIDEGLATPTDEVVGTFEWTDMPQRLCNTPNTHQVRVNKTLRHLIGGFGVAEGGKTARQLFSCSSAVLL